MEMENTYAGFGARNVGEFLPEAVMRNSRGFYSLSERAVIAVLVNAVNELSAEVATLKARQSEYVRWNLSREAA
jgi:hypothetical protein